MRIMGMKQVLLGALGAAVLLAGCDEAYNRGRFWSLTSQEDYFPNRHKGETEKPGATPPSDVFRTFEQGYGGSGNENERDNIQDWSQVSRENQRQLWLQQDYRVPYPPPQLDSLIAMELGTGKALKAGPHGAWVQGTYAVELGSGLTQAVPAPTSAPFQPEERTQGSMTLPRAPSERGASAPHGQMGQPPSGTER